MSDLFMNLETNDLDIQNNDLYMANGDDAIAQDLQQQLQLWLGEWFLDTTKGVPYKQIILVKNPNLDLVQASLTDTVLNVPGIAQMLDFSITYDPTNRAASVEVEAQSTSGQTLAVSANIGTPLNGTIEGTPY